MADTPPPMNFDDEENVPATEEETEQSPFLDPETSAMDEIQPSPVVDINLEDDNEDDPVEPETKPVELPLESLAIEEEEVAPPPTLETRAADEEEEVKVQAKPVEPVAEGRDLFDDQEPAAEPTQQVCAMSLPKRYNSGLFMFDKP